MFFDLCINITQTLSHLFIRNTHYQTPPILYNINSNILLPVHYITSNITIHPNNLRKQIYRQKKYNVFRPILSNQQNISPKKSPAKNT